MSETSSTVQGASRDHPCADAQVRSPQAQSPAGARQPRTFDFRTGRCGWGHNLHAFTWKTVSPRTETKGLLWWKREYAVAMRASVMVHAGHRPEVGDRLLMSGESGRDWNLKIVDVEPCRDPGDMFTLTLEFDQPPEVASPSGGAGYCTATTPGNSGRAS